MPLSIETMPKSKRGRPAKYDYSDRLALNDEGYGEPFIVLRNEDYDCSTISKQVSLSRYAHDNGVNVITTKMKAGSVVKTIVENDDGTTDTVEFTLPDEGIGVQFVSTDVKPYTSRKARVQE